MQRACDDAISAAAGPATSEVVADASRPAPPSIDELRRSLIAVEEVDRWTSRRRHRVAAALFFVGIVILARATLIRA
jgi:hypothetical protein